MGIDGRIFPVGSKPADTDSMFADDWFPVQVKQSEKVGRPEIDKFEAVMEREGSGGRQRGFFVAFSYTRDSEQECAAFHKRTGRIIKILTVQEILDEEHVQKMSVPMPQDPLEQFAGNSAINAEIHKMLSSFPEPSRSMMRKKIRQDKATLDRLGTDQADESARHTFREFLVARQLNSTGFCFEYNKSVNGQTPDWYEGQNKIVLEVFTCERGGRSSPVQRVATRLAEKATKYRALVRDKSLHFVIAVHGDVLSAFDADDCEEAIADDRLFERHPEVSGVIWFGETKVVPVKQTDGSMSRKQLYGYSYFPNPNATRKIDLSSNLRAE